MNTQRPTPLLAALALILAFAVSTVGTVAAEAQVKPGTSSLSGTVLRASGEVATSGVVYLVSATDLAIVSAEISTSGLFYFDKLGAGTYRARFESLPSLVPSYYGGSSFSSARTITVKAGKKVVLTPTTLPDGASITGTVSCECVQGDKPTNGVSVELYDEHGERTASRSFNSSSRPYAYSMTGLAPGRYALRYQINSYYENPWAAEYSGDVYSLEDAEYVDLAALENTILENVVIRKGTTLTGSVSGLRDGVEAPLTSGTVRLAHDAVTSSGVDATIDAQGNFSFANVAPGRYVVSARGNSWARGWYGGTQIAKDATYVDVLADGSTAPIAITVRPSANLGGVVTTATGTPVAHAPVKLWRMESDGTPSYLDVVGFTNASGEFSLALPAGDYKYLVMRPTGMTEFFPVYSGGALTLEAASTVTLGEAETVSDSVSLPVFGPVVERIGGADTYTQSILISRAGFEPGVPVVYVTSGATWSYAAAAAAAAAGEGAPILLVKPKSIAAATVAEIVRLQPQRIVVVGSTTVVSSAVAKKLSTLAPSSTRIKGTDRYALSLALSRTAFVDKSTPEMFFVEGNTWQSSLVAASGAAGAASPLILNNPSTKTASAGVATAIDSMRTSRLHSVGRIRESLYNSLYWQPVVDQIEQHRVATELYTNIYENPETVFLASSTNYTGALTFAPLSAALDAPLFLVKTKCVPKSVIDEIKKLGATRIVLLGSTKHLTAGVASLKSC